MRYEHRFRARAPLADVVEFHRRASSLPAITPPPLAARLESSPEVLDAGDEMSFTVGLGPFRIRWVARIEESTASGFVDSQISGPFASWEHRHSFTEIDAATTEVVDRIESKLKAHPIYGPAGFAMWLGLPLLFAYRGWKTRRLLERPRVAVS